MAWCPSAEPPAELVAEFDGLADEVRARIDEVELTAALDEIWRRIKRLNRYVKDEEPWQLAKDDAEAEALDEVLYALAEGLRVVSVLLHPFMPGVGGAAARGARPRRSSSLERPSWARWAAARKVGELGQLFPRVEAEAPAA